MRADYFSFRALAQMWRTEIPQRPRFVRCLNLPATFALLLLDNSYHHDEWLTPASFRGTSGNSQHPNRQAAARMYRDFAYSLFISFAGAILFLLVDRLEHNGPVASFLKFLILFVSSVVIIHRLRPYGLSLF